MSSNYLPLRMCVDEIEAESLLVADEAADYFTGVNDACVPYENTSLYLKSLHCKSIQDKNRLFEILYMYVCVYVCMYKYIQLFLLLHATLCPIVFSVFE